MKLSLILITVFFTFNFSFSQTNMVLASYSDGEVGRCTGSSYCTACTNCSRCGHCGSGGSCGVCSKSYRATPKKASTYKPSSSRVNKSSNSYTSKLKTVIYNLPNDISSKYYLKNLIVNIEVLNLRSGPGTSYSVIETLQREQRLTFLAMTENWVKVKVNLTKTIGFVYYKHILVSTK